MRAVLVAVTLLALLAPVALADPVNPPSDPWRYATRAVERQTGGLPGQADVDAALADAQARAGELLAGDGSDPLAELQAQADAAQAEAEARLAELGADGPDPLALVDEAQTQAGTLQDSAEAQAASMQAWANAQAGDLVPFVGRTYMHWLETLTGWH